MTSSYRPFHRRWVEAGRRLNNTVYQLPKIYPSADADNLVIGVLDPGSPAPFSVLCARDQPDDKLVGAGNAMQFLPRYVYEPPTADVAVTSPNLLDGEPPADASGRRHGITDYALDTYRQLDPAVERDDIFFYVYGIFHSPDYRIAFAADLRRSLPRIPQVTTASTFWAYAAAGRELGHLHAEYEMVESWPELTYIYAADFDPQHPDAYRVLKMKHPKVAKPHGTGKVDDVTRIIYNDWITIGGVPERAYGYELGSRSAVAWVMEANRVRTDKASGIRNDPNDWSVEHDDPTYILDLVGRVVAVSMRTLDLVESLPPLNL